MADPVIDNLKQLLATHTEAEIVEKMRQANRARVAEAEAAKVVTPPAIGRAALLAVIAHLRDGGGGPEYHLAYKAVLLAMIEMDGPKLWRALLGLAKSCRLALPHFETPPITDAAIGQEYYDALSAGLTARGLLDAAATQELAELQAAIAAGVWNVAQEKALSLQGKVFA